MHSYILFHSDVIDYKRARSKWLRVVLMLMYVYIYNNVNVCRYLPIIITLFKSIIHVSDL